MRLVDRSVICSIFDFSMKSSRLIELACLCSCSLVELKVAQLLHRFYSGFAQFCLSFVIFYTQIVVACVAYEKYLLSIYFTLLFPPDCYILLNTELSIPFGQHFVWVINILT